MTSISNISLEDLQALIDKRIDQRVKQFLPDQSLVDIEENEPEDTRTLQEVFESIERNRWTPPPGAPTPTQMLREDRDR